MNYLKTLAGAAMFAPLAAKWAALFPSVGGLAGERGERLPSDAAMLRTLKNAMFVDYDRRALVQTMREMDQKDGRVKMVHGRAASDVIRGGLVMQTTSTVLREEWGRFESRLQLDNWEKLKSDARGLVMEGNLPLQLVLDDTANVVAAVRMPSETIVPMVDLGGRFKSPAAAFEQRYKRMAKSVLAHRRYQGGHAPWYK